MSQKNATDELCCQACKRSFPKQVNERSVHYCPFCGMAQLSVSQSSSLSEATLREESVIWSSSPPTTGETLFELDSYRILKHLGKGGMGEVFLAYDMICGRQVALKRIRTDLQTHSKLYGRFLREARLTSQLIHPAIIPIYSIHQEGTLIYYTMPYVEGPTLKQIIQETRKQQREGETLHATGGSILALLRIFLSTCHAIAYAHSHGVLHRDLKPDNIIVGKYGEITILDWGLAKVLDERFSLPEEEEGEELDLPEVEGLTIPGKVVGTATHMAPERALGGPASVQTEVYALGITLYQLLTLRLPFRRKSLEKFREQMDKEVLKNPAEVAPYREISPSLARIASRCLEKDLSVRYATVDQLIQDIENYLEGRSDWQLSATLDNSNKSDWAFQEHVLPTEHIAITRSHEVTDWVTLMLSSASFPGNIRIETELQLEPGSSGLGLMICVPTDSNQSPFSGGYCLWLSNESRANTTLYRSNLEVLHRPDLTLKPGHCYTLRLDKQGEHLSFYLDGQFQFSYVSHLPTTGDHVGLLSRDTHYQLKNLRIYSGSIDSMVSCLSVPDSFLACQEYEKAVKEYQRIAESFAGRREGREALFRIGVTLVEQAKLSSPELSSLIFDRALEAFEKLRSTPAAPQEYLGKSLVYQAQQERQEEINCLELGLRRYAQHPMSHILRDQVVYRMHESSREDRLATYRFALLVLQLIPEVTQENASQRLLKYVAKHWEPLPFIDRVSKISWTHQALILAFWLQRPHAICEIIEKLPAEDSTSEKVLNNALSCLCAMQQFSIAKELLESQGSLYPKLKTFPFLQQLVEGFLNEELLLKELEHMPQLMTTDCAHRLLLILDLHLEHFSKATIESISPYFNTPQLSPSIQLTFDSLYIKYLLQKGHWKEAGSQLFIHSQEELSTEGSPLYFCYGCWLLLAEGKEIAHIHFSSGLESAYPKTTALGGQFITGKLHEESPWFKHAFCWEKWHLYRQVALWEHCQGHETQSLYYQAQAQEVLNHG